MAFPATFLSVQDAVINKLRLDSTADRPMVKDHINQTYADVAQETRCFQQDATTTLTAGTATYTLDTDVLQIELLTVTSGGVLGRPLRQRTPKQIRDLRSVNANATGPPTDYALTGQSQIELWPAPLTGDVLNTTYSFLPTALSADADTISIVEPYGSNLLEYGAAVKAAEFKKDPDLQNLQASYAGWLVKFQRYLNRKQGAYPRAFPIQGDDLYVPHDPSVDIATWP